MNWKDLYAWLLLLGFQRGQGVFSELGNHLRYEDDLMRIEVYWVFPTVGVRTKIQDGVIEHRQFNGQVMDDYCGAVLRYIRRTLKRVHNDAG